MSALDAPIRCEATLQRPATPRNATWSFVVLPAPASARLPTRSMTTVDVRVCGQAFRATLEPDGAGSHWLKLPRALRDAAGLRVGEQVTLELVPVPVSEAPEPRLPSDLRAALATDDVARAQWKSLTPVARRDWIQWLDSARQEQTRVRRIHSTIDMLLAGKRRVCCFDRSGMYSKSLAAPVAANPPARRRN